jgi:hypothetical protein
VCGVCTTFVDRASPQTRPGSRGGAEREKRFLLQLHRLRSRLTAPERVQACLECNTPQQPMHRVAAQGIPGG